MKRFIYIILLISVAGIAYAGKTEKKEHKREVIFKKRVLGVSKRSEIMGKYYRMIDAYSRKKAIGTIQYLVEPWNLPIIKVVTVDDGKKRRGIGTGLVKKALKDIKKSCPGVEKVGIEVVLEGSEPFWEALGAQPAEKNGQYIDFYLSLKEKP